MLPQYDGTNARSLVEGLLGLLQTEMGAPLNSLHTGMSIENGAGDLLDCIAVRMGLVRPNVAPEDGAYFGFMSSSRFGLPFYPTLRLVREPIADTEMKRLMHARALTMRVAPNREGVQLVLDVLFGLDGTGTSNAAVTDGNGSYTVSVRNTTAQFLALVNLNKEQLLPRAAGVSSSLVLA